MPDEPITPTSEPPAPVIATPPAPTAVAPPVAVAPAPAAAAGGKKMHHISEDKLIERANRIAAQKIKEQLGCTIEEARARLKGSKDDKGRRLVPATVEEKENERITRLESKNRELRDRIQDQKNRVLKVKQREREKRIELAIRHEALASGILEDHVDFAVSRFSRAMQDPAFLARVEKREIDERGFFASLREKMPYLFAVQPPPPVTVPVAASSAPPESATPGGGPNEGTPAVVQVPVDVDKMTDAEFKAHRRRTHNF